MINLVVTGYNGAATQPLVGHFDELGGNIGRAENNQLVLPDPERTISRVHAQVVFRNGRYGIIDRGSNPISVNGRPLGNGQEAPINPGDELQIGGYSMRVEAAAGAPGAPAPDPFADFAGLAATPAAARGGAAPAGGGFGDPLAGFGAPAAPVPRGGLPPAPAPAPAPGGIPADWNPFAPDAPAPAGGPMDPLGGRMGGAPGAFGGQGSAFGGQGSAFGGQGSAFGLDTTGRAEALIPDFAPGSHAGGDSLDALFGLGASGTGADPLAGSSLGQAAAQPNMAAHHDPLKSLNSVTRGSASSAADTSSELSAPFQLPPMGVPAGASGRPPARPPAMPAAPAGPRPPPLGQRPPPGHPPGAGFPPAPAHADPFGAAAPPAGGGNFIPEGFDSDFSGLAPAAVPPPPAAPAMARPSAGPMPAPMAAPAAAGRAGDTVAPPGSVLSWDDPSGESRTVIRPRGASPATATRPPTPTPGRPAAPTPPPIQPTPIAAPPGDDLDIALDFDAPGAPMAAAPADPFAAMMPPALAPAAPTRPLPPQAPPSVAPPVARPAPPPPATPAPPVPPAPPRTPAAGTPAWRPPPGVAAPPGLGGTAAGGADVQALTAAFREGLQAPSLPPDLVLTPALMKLVGKLVHEATRGTVELLVARAALKREIRAEVTMIVAKENNPLKFSPSAEVALGHLLAPPARGFMEGDRAMRDAYDDLRAHQFGFLAGMRAALEGILKRFDPAVLETKLTQKSMLSSLLPAKRKAQMWDVFIQLYGQISSEASDDFHELFGKEFLRAYNEYIEQLEQDGP